MTERPGCALGWLAVITLVAACMVAAFVLWGLVLIWLAIT